MRNKPSTTITTPIKAELPKNHACTKTEDMYSTDERESPQEP